VVNDAGFRIWNAYNVRAWSTVALIDRRGKIAMQKSGEIDARREAQLNDPRGLALSASRLYVADAKNHLMRIANMETGRLAFETEVDADTRLALDLSVYYCGTKDQRRYRIHNRRLILSISAKESAGKSTQITYQLKAPLSKWGRGDSTYL
jgi:hypothetical protein